MSDSDTFTQTDGLLIRDRRIALGYGMNRFAAIVGISGPGLSRIENGLREPRPETLKKINEALNTDDGSSSATLPVSAQVIAKLRMLRRERSVSARALAESMTEAGYRIQRSVIANLESGRRAEVSVDHFVAAARALNADPASLLRDVTSPCPRCNGTPPDGFTCNTCGGAA